MALFNIIKWDALPNVAAYRYPSEKIRLGSELFVSETQRVVLLKAGKLIRVFEPGRHILATGNLPLHPSDMEPKYAFYANELVSARPQRFRPYFDNENQL